MGIIMLLYIFFLANYLENVQLYPQVSLVSYDNMENVKIYNRIITLNGKSIILKFNGDEMDEVHAFKFSSKPPLKGQECDKIITWPNMKILSSPTEYQAVVKYEFSHDIPTEIPLYLCVDYCSHINNRNNIITHSIRMPFIIKKPSFVLPFPACIVILIILYSLSGVLSGLNLGLMSLTMNELLIIRDSGTPRQKKYAKKVIPLRQKGSVSLCAIVLTSTLLNSASTILLQTMSTGLVAVLTSTFIVMIFCEIIPQSIFSRFSLLILAKLKFVINIIFFITFPISFPLGKLLDFIFRNTKTKKYNKNQLIEIIKDGCEPCMDTFEKNIIYGGLAFKEKTVGNIMKELKDCFIISKNAILDRKTMNAIVKFGFNRIPVYFRAIENIVAVLYTKDIAFVDPEDKITVSDILDGYCYKLLYVHPDDKLDKVLDRFKNFETHLAIVADRNIVNRESVCPAAIGLFTLRDLIKEMIQVDIIDDDKCCGYVPGVGGKNTKKNQLYKQVINCGKYHNNWIQKLSNQQIQNIAKFLRTSIEEFNVEKIYHSFLEAMLSKDENILFYNERATGTYIYRKNKKANYFVLVLEGNVEVIAGKENYTFVQGPYSYHGLKSLKNTPENLTIKPQDYIADFSLKTLGNVLIFKIRTKLYQKALRKINMSLNQCEFENDTFTSVFSVNSQLNNSTLFMSDSGLDKNQENIIIISKSDENLI